MYDILVYKFTKFWKIHKKNTCFSCSYYTKNELAKNELGYASKSFYENNGMTVIEFNTDMLK